MPRRRYQPISRTGPCRQAVGVCAVADGRLRQLFWRAAHQLDYVVTLVRLRILDALAGPLPETPADREGSETRKR